jgi:hypothetical protein
MCNICPLNCEVIRETDGQNTLQILKCKGGGVGELGKSCKQPSNNINIYLILEESIPMLGI